MSDPTLTPAQQRVLDALPVGRNHGDPLTVRDLVEVTGANASTVRRALAVLRERGLVVHGGGIGGVGVQFYRVVRSTTPSVASVRLSDGEVEGVLIGNAERLAEVVRPEAVVGPAPASDSPSPADDGELPPELADLVDRAVDRAIAEGQALDRWWRSLNLLDRLAVYRLATGDMLVEHLGEQQ